MKGYPIDLIGAKISRLTVLSIAGKTPSGKKWVCQCECGNRLIKLTTQLTRVQKTGGCTGCRECESLSRSNPKIVHGGCRFGKSRLYRIWKMMRSRCRFLGDTSWKYYGGKGIQVCIEWQSFEIFREWALMNGYNDLLSIDRLNANGNYEPNNCEWVTRSENSRRAALSRRQRH